MVIEKAGVRFVPKPWGAKVLRPWYSAPALETATAIGEICYDRADAAAPRPSLLLKLLFTTAPLSVQVHPDDAYARKLGLPNGKTEAWYILDAERSAKIALGLTRKLTSPQLRDAIEDGSIADMIRWLPAAPGDVISIPAGTIHAAGAGLVLAEVQQRSDSTFRLLDPYHSRELHIDEAVAVANLELASPPTLPDPLSPERALLVENAHFRFERITLPATSIWRLRAACETWLLVIGGDVSTDAESFAVGDVLFAQSASVILTVGEAGATCLAAYTGGSPETDLLQRSP